MDHLVGIGHNSELSDSDARERIQKLEAEVAGLKAVIRIQETMLKLARTVNGLQTEALVRRLSVD